MTKISEVVHAIHPGMKMVSTGANSLISQPLVNGSAYDTPGTTGFHKADRGLRFCILYFNGFQNYNDEAQRQLDEWLASQK